MPRTPNPNGDPVAIRKKGDIYKVRYYPTGIITKPADRKEVPGVFQTRGAAEAQAALLREKLVEHREIHLPGGNRGLARLSTVLSEYLADQQRSYEAGSLPLGTGRKIKSDMHIYVEPVAEKLDVRVKDLPAQAAKTICDGVTLSGKSENTITASQWSIKHFGFWLVTKGFLFENPFTRFIESNDETVAEKKGASESKLLSEPRKSLSKSRLMSVKVSVSKMSLPWRWCLR